MQYPVLYEIHVIDANINHFRCIHVFYISVFSFSVSVKQRQFEKRAKRRVIRQLHDHVRNDRILDVAELLKSELDVNFHYNGETALQIAVVYGHEKMCKLLIEQGGDVDKSDAEENCLLNMAAWRGHTNIVQLLVNHEAELNKMNSHGATPLCTAAYRGFPLIAQILINADCFIDKPNLHQQTPLFVSSKRGHVAVVQSLIAGGCDLNWCDLDRKTPLIAAAEEGHVDIAQLLVNAGLVSSIFS